MQINIEKSQYKVIVASQQELLESGFDIVSANEFLIIGQLVYKVLTTHVVFINVCQENKSIGRLLRCIPAEKLLKRYVSATFENLDFWDSDKFGILEKTRISYKLIGYLYGLWGYDKLFSSFEKVVLTGIMETAALPISDYTHIVESHIWKIYHKKLTFNVSKTAYYSEQDSVYQASCIFKSKSYTAYGYSKKKAIDNVSKEMAMDIIGRAALEETLKGQGNIVIEAQPFDIGSTDYDEKDNQLIKLSNYLGIDCIFLRFSLLSRSQMGKNIWEKQGIPVPDFIKTSNASRFKRGLINFGELILLLMVFEYNLSVNTLKSIDLSMFDVTIQNVGREEVISQMHKVFRTKDFASFLFSKLQIFHGTLTNNDSYQIGSNIVASFFISNFEPNKRFQQVFSSLIEEFYRTGLNVEIDYRFALLTFLSTFNVRPDIVGYETDNGYYHTELILDKSKPSPKFISDDVSMRDAKISVWKDAYTSTVTQIQTFFFDPIAHVRQDILTYLLDCICEATQSAVEQFFRNFGVLDAKNYSILGRNRYVLVLENIHKAVNDDIKYDKLIKRIAQINKKYFVVIGENVYSYAEALACSFDSTFLHKKGISNVNDKLSNIYQYIVNPNIAIQKRLISQNYKMVNLINPIDFEVAKLAIDQDIDSYNYIITPNEEITIYYEKALEQFEKFQAQNFGQLYCESNKDCTIIILDSHRSVSQQLEELISSIELKRATIACGYCYKSGLSLLKETITKTVYNGVPLQFIIGSLQNYRYSAESGSIITGIDVSTIRKLNEYLEYDNVSIYTCEDRFYHGKLYVFEGQDKSIICMGSSNISKSAYVSNYELNLAFIVPTKSSLKEKFDLWVKQLLQYSTRMSCFDEALFGDNELRLEGSVVIKQISKNIIQKRIDELTNSEVQYRLNLWMSYSPDIIAEDLGILTLPNYIVFVYNEYKLLVLESLSAGNSYFCLHYDDSFETVINNISTFSKTELFEYSQMTKRGYHLSNKFTLENNIRRYFRS